MTEQELKKALEVRNLWIDSGYTNGERMGFRAADLRYANLRDVNLFGANLFGAKLRGTVLFGANLKDADIRDADLRDADLKDANLRDADLRGADLRGADSRGADLTDANLFGAHLLGTDLRGAVLNGANLKGVNLRTADLREVDLSCANLRKVNLRTSDLRGAVLKDVDLTGADLSDAKYDKETIFPDGFDPIERGMILVEVENKMIDNCIHDGTLDKPDKILVYAQSESLLSKKTRMAKAEVESEIHFTETLIAELLELAEDAKAELVKINEFLDTPFITEQQLYDAWDNLELISSIWIEELGIEADFYRNQSCDWAVIKE